MRGIEAAFSGRLGNDPEEKISAKGTVWCSFIVAVDGNEEQPTWVKVAAFSDVARRCCLDLKKGSRCYVEGALRLTTWQDKTTGEQRHGLELAWHVTRAGKNKPAKPRSGRAMRFRGARRSATGSGPPTRVLTCKDSTR
jgi:single-stranded DNA-binding protein